MLIPVILSGGAGSRLWPVSREALPKPFIRLPSGESLLQKTMLRATSLPEVSDVITVTNRDHYFLTRDEYESLDIKGVKQHYLLETAGRNTAPAIAAAAIYARERFGDDSILLILPADHLIRDTIAFGNSVLQALALAKRGMLLTFGLRPLRPETGFGYIECGPPVGGGMLVKRFVEKPDVATAQDYVADGGFLWNSGMFCFGSNQLLEVMEREAVAVYSAARLAMEKAGMEQQPVILEEECFSKSPEISIDYAVMERADNVAVVPAEFDWSDIGSWNALAELVAPDQEGNRLNGQAMAIASRNCYVQSEDRVVALVGLEGISVIDTPDALLVMDREKAQEVRQVVQRLKLQSNDVVIHHRTERRPWGTFTVLEKGEGFKLKRIVVKPGHSLSLQMHHHRSEHWVVVSGMAKVTNGELEIFVRPNESTYIPAGTVHRLENPGLVECVMIEVQVGEYLGEDDIVRFDDTYGRA